MPLIPFHDTEPSGITPRFTIALIVINILVGVAQWTDPDHLIEGALRPAWFFSYLSGEETGSVSKHELQNRDSLENVFGVPTDNPGEIRLTFANFDSAIVSVHVSPRRLFSISPVTWFFCGSLETTSRVAWGVCVI